MNIKIEDQIQFIKEFENKRVDWIDYANFLNDVLNEAVQKLSLLAIVQCRPKGVISFANKIISKDKYKEPLKDITDLCGARVIVHFQSQVEKVCDFIKDNFEIDEANSLDLRSRLKVNEFGYRSIHYIVTPKSDLIIRNPKYQKFKSMKAEIQVRTLAEHIWADISHDRIYKTDLHIPDEWGREAARLSAMLEKADQSFAQMAQEIDTATKVFDLQYQQEKAKNDIQKFETLIQVLVGSPLEQVKNALKLTEIYRAQNELKKATELFKEFINPVFLKEVTDAFLKQQLLFEYGYVLAMMNRDDKGSEVYQEGLDYLSKSIIQLENFRAKENCYALSSIFYRYGKFLQYQDADESKSLPYFNKAYNLMPNNAMYLVALVEANILCNRALGNTYVDIFRSALEEAVPSIKRLISIGIKNVPALFAIGHCYYFLNEEKNYLSTYILALKMILDTNCLTSLHSIEAEIAFLIKCSTFNSKLNEEIIYILNLALYLYHDCKDAGEKCKGKLVRARINKTGFIEPVVIVVGGAEGIDKEKAQTYREYLNELMRGFRGTILSGGTTSGVPGLLGELKNSLPKNDDFKLVAYLPETLPLDAEKSKFYDEFFQTARKDFSIWEVLSYWTDILLAGICPSEVLLIGINGGNISAYEYRLALALGAKVGIISYSGRAVSDIVVDCDWKNHPNLLEIPNDPFTVWALVNQSVESVLSTDEIEELAPLVHEYYRQKKLKELKPDKPVNDINTLKVLMPWEALEEGLKNSNRKQIAFFKLALNRAGLDMRKAENPLIMKIKDNINEAELEFLAKLEHARWNAERLLEGWKWGQKKDIVNKINPNLTEWEKLSKDIQGYDYEAVENIPVILAAIGFEVYKLKE